ncbi:MAG: hypothetical protein P1U61_06305 [Legionellaceae bacterium]|nr:hypothetical protein [Legionellaceae bacterium]
MVKLTGMPDSKIPNHVGTETTKGFEGLSERLLEVNINREEAIGMGEDEFETFMKEQEAALEASGMEGTEFIQRSMDLINLKNERFNFRQEYKGYIAMLDAKDAIDEITAHEGKFNIASTGRCEAFSKNPQQGISLKNMLTTKAEAESRGLSLIESHGKTSKSTSYLAKLCEWIKTTFCGKPAKPVQYDHTKTPSHNALNLDLAQADITQKKSGTPLQASTIEQQYNNISTKENNSQTPNEA